MSDAAHGYGRERQSAIYRAGVSGRRPAVPTEYSALRRKARRKSSAAGWAYVDGGAGSGATMRANREAFGKWAIVPRMLRDVSERDLSVELFGRRLPAPVLFAPIGAADLVHPSADLGIAAAAARLGVPYIFSSQACAPMERCAEVMGAAPRWFQLYWSTDEQLVDSFLERAERSGAEAVVVTLDTTLLGWRPQDLDLGSLPFAQGRGIAQYTADPRFRRMIRDRLGTASAEGSDVRPTLSALRALLSMSRRFPGPLLRNLRSPEPRKAVETFLGTYSRPSLNWSDVDTLRARTKLPIVLKGVLHPDDARRAADAGVDGIVVSNHGGRQVDGSIAALDALAEIAPVVGDRMRVLFDSGIRGGADVFKALALGAHAVAIGRPYLHGLAIAGAAGAHDAVADIIAEFDLTLGLSGCTSVAELGPDALRRT